MAIQTYALKNRGLCINELTLAVLLWTAGWSAAEVGRIDWEASSGCAPSWTFAGLRVDNARGTICVNSSPYVTNGTSSCNDVAGLVVSHVNGKEFTPLTIDLAEYYSTTNTDQIIHFIGHKPDGATVNASFELDLIADGPGGIDDFQNFAFPPEFSDIIRLEIPNSLWRFDNLTFSTVVPPELPFDQRLGPAFASATLLYSKPVLDNTLIIGPDFQFVSGFQREAPTKTKFLPTEGTAFLTFTISPFYDRADQALYYTTPNTYSVKKNKGGVVTDAADLHDPLSAGITVSTITKPRAANGRLLFMGSSTSPTDVFYLFEKKNDVTTALVTPETALPVGDVTSTPYYFPRTLAVHGGSYAFDTSLASMAHTWRIFASFDGKPLQHVIGAGDPIPNGENYLRVKSLGAFEFNSAGEIKVRATLSSGDAWLYFSGSALLRFELIAATASPLNAGKQVAGQLFKTDSGVTFLDTHGEIFRAHEGRYFRVIGLGDSIGGETVSYLELKAVRGTPPLRVIVEARYESSESTARILELLLNDPILLPPRFGATTIHPESGDLFIPLSHLTFGREYWLRRSDNLTDWTDLWKIDQVVPLQHVVIPPALLSSPSFFRVEER